MLNFCTLFDSKFLPYGLNLHESLLKNCKSFHLYIFAFDEKCLKTLQTLNLKHTTVISLSEFEDEELLAVKPTRTPAEYCWTCTPSVVLYCINNYNLENCTYIDSDVYFYDDPLKLVDEMGSNEILLTLHNYTPKYDQTALSGKFCVQFMTFLNKKEGISALKWWRNACIEWCYARVEDEKFGDQKYLDDWETRFNKVHVLQAEGGAIAPWNIQQYELKKDQEVLYVLKDDKKAPLNFYHFHGLRFLSEQKVNLCEYKLSSDVVKLVYRPYIISFMKHYHQLKKLDSSLDMLLPSKLNMKKVKSNTFNIFTGKYVDNVFSINKLTAHGQAN
ncbi:glycosyl transferase [Pontibacter rugosus]